MFTSPTPPPPAPPPLATNANHTKKKRRPAGTPDPDAEVVSLSPRTLLESDRYVCDICNQGFQRDQNLQMHRRRHKVPWKLVKRESSAAEGDLKKRVFVCPDPSCLHHEPSHALGDLVGIKKHFRRKHSDRRQWVCERCCKGYAVQSDYKAHLKTCGTRGHSCDCGRVFSRVESFIEHQDACNASRARPDPQTPETVSLSWTSSSPSPSTDAKLSAAARTWLDTRTPNSNVTAFLCPNLELHILPTSTSTPFPSTATSIKANAAQLHLSLWPGECSGGGSRQSLQDQLRFVIAEKALADEARQQAKLQVELAEQEFTNAKRIRQQAQAELDKALVLRDHAARSINSILFQITCHACRQRLRPKPHNNNSLAAVASYMSSVVTEEQELV